MRLLICDLDGTLLGDERALDDFASWYTRAKWRFRLAYSSGRFIDSILQSIEQSNLPAPDAVIGGVGTEMYDVAADRRFPLWPPLPCGWNPHVVRTICESHRDLTPQPEHFVSYHKVSYYGRNLDRDFLDRLINQLVRFGQQVNIVYSSSRDLDVVPRDVHKGTAAAFLAQHWRISAQRVIVAGDSGNDAMMFGLGFRGIVVGNALPELRGITGPHVYHAKAEFAGGVLEGIAHWLGAEPINGSTGD